MDAALAAVLDQLDEAGERSDAEALANENPRPLPPYARLNATAPTTLPAAAASREATLKLTGDMTRYLWSSQSLHQADFQLGPALCEASPIQGAVEANEIFGIGIGHGGSLKSFHDCRH
jgi:hypothetical protein